MLENIKRIAKLQGKTIDGIEKKLDLHNLYRWDEHRPSIDKVKMVADELGVTIDELLGEE